ncbi:DUF2785 domain-containing protein [Rossellomorea aquimaris]|uniref:DUF2785 domain-containing protein n=1 Tax=Rossellomorea aquimaris TaxID=189382 RepID=UPI0005C91D4D|nr:DUF2785 domain-containing protein [Rossellomorea aquimaris]
MDISLRNKLLGESELKSILTEYKNERCNWQEVDKTLVLQSMMEHIGSTDGELRDQLIYTSFYRLIVESNQIEAELLTVLLDACMNERMFKGIGEKDSDTVFTRAFTTLLIALILYRDNQADFLPQNLIDTVKEKLITYIELEEDLRGYVPGKGWAHSIAHVADTFEELVKNPKLDKEDYPVIVRVLCSKVLISDSVYVHDEDERLLTPILEMIERGLNVKEIEQFLQEIPNQLKIQKAKIENEKYWFLVFNIKSFLKSFHFKINDQPKLLPLQKKIEETLAKVF